MARAEWDTLLFFYGVIACVGGLGFLGYLHLISVEMYSNWGPTTANVAVGLLSSIVDNIPVVFAVLTMQPDMSDGQWLLVTPDRRSRWLTVIHWFCRWCRLDGASTREIYLFSHLKWTPVIALGYIASILTHFGSIAASFESFFGHGCPFLFSNFLSEMFFKENILLCHSFFF